VEAEPPRDDTEDTDGQEEREGRDDLTNHLLLRRRRNGFLVAAVATSLVSGTGCRGVGSADVHGAGSASVQSPRRAPGAAYHCYPIDVELVVDGSLLAASTARLTTGSGI
jgi:hypothetical protein